MTYKIVEQNLSTLLNKIARVNAKLARIGTPAVTYKLNGHVDEPHPADAAKLVRYINLEVEIPKTEANGWEFIATLVHTTDGNIVRNVPGYTVPVEFRDKATWCDHCRCNRTRRDTYVVRHADGRVMQVGSNCLEEFIGVPAGRLTSACRLLLGVADVCESAQKTNWLGGHSGLTTYRIDLDTFLAHVAQIVLTEGSYVTRKMAQARGNVQTTPERAYYSMMHKTLPVISDEATQLAIQARSFVMCKLSPSLLDDAEADDAALMDSVMSTLKAVNIQLSDFEHNLLSCARAEAIEPRLIGTAGYIVEYYRRELPTTVKATANVTELPADGLAKIFALFRSAKDSKLAHPAIRLADASGLKLHMSLAGAQSKNAGCIYVKKADADKSYLGKITPQGRFLPVAACPSTVEAQLKAFAADPEAVATKYGKLTGCCCFCGRGLTDDRSTDVGFGPVCASKYGLSAKWRQAESAAAPEAVEAPAAA